MNMELDELMNRARSIKAPAAAGRRTDQFAASLETLMQRLKELDAKEQERLRRMKRVFGIAALLYGALLTLTWILPPDGDAGRVRLVFALFTLVFASVVAASLARARRIAAIDYSGPVGTYLRESEERYAFTNRRAILLFVPFFIIVTFAAGVGWMNSFARYFSHYDPSTGLISFVALWVMVCIVGAVTGALRWKNVQRPIVEEIRRLRKELDTER
jgi:hypothetical protein